MHRWSIISLVLVCGGCTVRLPDPSTIRISVKATTRVEARVQPAQPEVVVALENAPVVEFFGIPLEGAQDVVFLLDCSGSMDDPARGRIAQIHVPTDTARQAPAPAPPPTDTGPTTGAAPPPPPPPPPPTDAPPAPAGDAPPAPAADAQPAPPAPKPVRKIDVAKAELVSALERLPEGTRLNVLFFNDELEAFAPNAVPLEDKAALITFVKGAEPSERTALAPAMRTAFLMNARRVVLLSDGLGNIGGNADAVLRDAREAIRGGVRIDTIGLGTDQDGWLLQGLASESGGLYQPL